MTKTTTFKTLIPLILLIAGCNEDERVARIAREAADRQAKQNEEMVRLNREVAEGTKRLVEADAEARREMVVVHQELQGERGELNEQWTALESERQGIAQQRRTESMLVPVAKAVGITLLAAVVIGFCWTLLYGLRQHDESDAQLTELLIHDIVSDQPALLPTRSARSALTAAREAAGEDARLLTDETSDHEPSAEEGNP